MIEVQPADSEVGGVLRARGQVCQHGDVVGSDEPGQTTSARHPIWWARHQTKVVQQAPVVRPLQQGVFPSGAKHLGGAEVGLTRIGLLQRRHPGEFRSGGVALQQRLVRDDHR